MREENKQEMDRVEEALGRVFQSAAPNPEFVQALEQQLLSRVERMEAPVVKRSRWQRFWQGHTHRLRGMVSPPHTRLGWALLFLVVFLFVGTTTYATNSLISRLFSLEAGLEQVDYLALYEELDQSQSQDGVTVRVARAYADANRIVIAYLVESPEGGHYEPSRVSLHSASGIEFPRAGEMGFGAASEIIRGELPPNTRAYIASFNARPAVGTPSRLALRLTVSVARFDTVVNNDPVADGASEDSDRTGVAEEQLVTVSEPIGPFQFAFTVPFYPAKMVEVQQAVTRDTSQVRVCPMEGCLKEFEEIHDVAVRLEEVAITPSETRATVCVDGPDGLTDDFNMVGAIRQDTGREIGLTGSALIEGTPCRDLHFLAALGDETGTWTLEITEIISWEYNTRWNEYVDQRRIQGPWTFTFEVR